MIGILWKKYSYLTQIACLEVCNEISASTSAEKAAEKLENAYKFEETENVCTPKIARNKKKYSKTFLKLS